MSRSLLIEELKPYVRKYFIETGTYMGGGVEMAYYVGFERIYSIESDERMWRESFERYYHDNNITILLGNSPDVLRELLPKIEEPAVIFLDAHSPEYNPIFDELEVISDQKIKTNVIMIDDLREYGGSFWNNTVDELVAAIKGINPNYIIRYMDSVNAKGDILVAEVR